jgi:N-acetylglucosamine kinase-like BadF-type ATPase
MIFHQNASQRRHCLVGLTCPVEAVNDVVIGLIAGSSQGWGVVVDAGTGCNVRARDSHGKEGWVTGCGSPFGEYGGAGDIVHRAVQPWRTNGPAVDLHRVIRYLSFSKPAHDLTDLIEGLALERYTLNSTNARAVFEAAQTGDKVAQDVIAWVAGEWVKQPMQ